MKLKEKIEKETKRVITEKIEQKKEKDEFLKKLKKEIEKIRQAKTKKEAKEIAKKLKEKIVKDETYWLFSAELKKEYATIVRILALAKKK